MSARWASLGELLGREHPGFVDDHGGADGEVVAVVGRPVEGVLDEQLVDRVGGDAGLLRQHLGAGGRRGDAEHGAAVGAEVLDGGAQCGGLAGAGGADDEDEIGVAGDGARGVGLGQGHVDVAAVDGGGIVGAVVFEAAVGPLDERPLPGRGSLGW